MKANNIEDLELELDSLLWEQQKGFKRINELTVQLQQIFCDHDREEGQCVMCQLVDEREPDIDAIAEDAEEREMIRLDQELGK